MKAKVINKIVREGSGMYNYTLVPPLPGDEDRFEKNGKNDKENFDPHAHPTLRPYALESNLKPVVASFGHRPKSASRVFHPSTMKIRLKHGEIIDNYENKTGFGLPVSVLARLLHAPRLPHNEDLTLGTLKYNVFIYCLSYFFFGICGSVYASLYFIMCVLLYVLV